MDDLYLERPNLYIGFHGCEKENGLKLVNEPRDIISSKADHEWLGKGFYVWENNQDRAWDWAKNHKPEPFKLFLSFAEARHARSYRPEQVRPMRRSQFELLLSFSVLKSAKFQHYRRVRQTLTQICFGALYPV